MSVLRDVRLGWQMARQRDQIEFSGLCSCGCGKWVIIFRGRRYRCNEGTYDTLRYVFARLP